MYLQNHHNKKQTVLLKIFLFITLISASITMPVTVSAGHKPIEKSAFEKVQSLLSNQEHILYAILSMPELQDHFKKMFGVEGSKINSIVNPNTTIMILGLFQSDKNKKQAEALFDLIKSISVSLALDEHTQCTSYFESSGDQRSDLGQICAFIHQNHIQEIKEIFFNLNMMTTLPIYFSDQQMKRLTLLQKRSHYSDTAKFFTHAIMRFIYFLELKTFSPSTTMQVLDLTPEHTENLPLVKELPPVNPYEATEQDTAKTLSILSPVQNKLFLQSAINNYYNGSASLFTDGMLDFLEYYEREVVRGQKSIELSNHGQRLIHLVHRENFIPEEEFQFDEATELKLKEIQSKTEETKTTAILNALHRYIFVKHLESKNHQFGVCKNNQIHKIDFNIQHTAAGGVARDHVWSELKKIIPLYILRGFEHFVDSNKLHSLDYLAVTTAIPFYHAMLNIFDEDSFFCFASQNGTITELRFPIILDSLRDY